MRNWRQAATKAEELIENWYFRYPRCNFGILTDRLIVINVNNLGDIDVNTVVDDFENQHRGDIPRTLSVLTGGGGYHIYLRNSESNLRIPNVQLTPRIDILADGGYVVGPGSIHPSGEEYWLINSAEIAEAPEWLKTILREQSEHAGGRHGR